MSYPLEKSSALLPTATTGISTPRKCSRGAIWALIAVGCISGLALTRLPIVKSCHEFSRLSHHTIEPTCPQSSVVTPVNSSGIWASLTQLVHTDTFKTRTVEWLSGAVQIPTESFDNMGPVGDEPRFEHLLDLHEYLGNAFPLLHQSLTVKKVNTYGLLYTWKGSDVSLKPILMCAHQDVVPVDPNSVNAWTHPPFSGYFDGQRIWGRGSSDDKSGLIGTMAAVELLLEKGFSPKRTIVLAFGFDEEIGGPQGAGYLAEEILSTWGENSFALVIDEGGGFARKYGTAFASPGVGEKGSVNVNIEVAAPGGHSSVPPSHTSIGILSALLVHFEENPFEVHLDRNSPIYKGLQCHAEHATDMSTILREAIKTSAFSDIALLAVEKVVFEDNVLKSLAGTTQAIDMIGGGVKTNALPEGAWAIINHRITTSSSVPQTKAHDAELLKSLAHKFNLTYSAFGNLVSEEGARSSGSLTLTAPIGLDPAPMTPTSENDIPWRVLGGTIKATYNAFRNLEAGNEDEIIVAPWMMTGNTDTKYYWSLTEHIFRYTHHNLGDNANPLASGVHTVNESIDADAVIEMVLFYATLILNVQEAVF